MKNYILTIITISIISGIVSSLLSSSKNGLKKHINLITGLILVLIVVTPITTIAKNSAILTEKIESIVGSLNIENSVNESNKIIISQGTDNICEGIENAIATRFNLSNDYITVALTVNDENIEAIMLEGITVTLTGKATWTDSDAIKEYTEDLVGCSVRVIKK